MRQNLLYTVSMVVELEKYHLIWKQHVIAIQDSRLPK
jgi:hypothetical protein